jgi:sugar lactone lactonase YvrE
VAGPRRLRAELLADARATLGEGPVWEPGSETILWVDILGRSVNRTGLDGRTSTVCRTPSDIGAVLPRASGGLVLVIRDGFWALDPGTTEARPLAPLPIPPTHRFNDAKCDPAGRVLAGTLAYSEDEPTGTLYRLDAGRVETLVEGVTVSNGLGWTPDGRTMYFIDSTTHRVDAFDYDVASGALSNRRPFVTIPDEEGFPDGLAVDVDGGVWVAMWGGRRVSRYLPDGRLEAVVEVPATHTTSCCFGGAGLDRLYITSARDRLSDDQLAAEPHAGGVFVVDPGVVGVPVAEYAG